MIGRYSGESVLTVCVAVVPDPNGADMLPYCGRTVELEFEIGG